MGAMQANGNPEMNPSQRGATGSILVDIIALTGLVLEPLLKFVLVSFSTVPLCSVFAYLVLKIPYADRVL